VLPAWHADALPLSIYYTSRKLVPAKARLFVEYIVQEFRVRGHAARFRQG
jgi:DNA-binding transcriptional LysR family regulator